MLCQRRIGLSSLFYLHSSHDLCGVSLVWMPRRLGIGAVTRRVQRRKEARGGDVEPPLPGGGESTASRLPSGSPR